jgi:hypothetical protein
LDRVGSAGVRDRIRRFVYGGDRDAAVVMCGSRAASVGQARVFRVGSWVSACLVVVGRVRGLPPPGWGVLSTLWAASGGGLLWGVPAGSVPCRPGG